jgi:3-methyladenine DNA glycosylase AlkD
MAQPGKGTNQKPERIVAQTLAFLSAKADPVRAESGQRYFKTPVSLYGVTTPMIRQYAKQVARSVGEIWTGADAVRFCDRLMGCPHVEAKAVGLLVLQEFAGSYRPSLLLRLKTWLTMDSGNWGTVDLLAGGVLAELLARYPRLVPKVETWVSSRQFWVRRGAVVAFVPHARHGRFLTPAYRIARRLLPDEEDLVQKAVGWLLREAGKQDRKRLERFLLRHGPAIPRTTLRYAIERFPDSERRYLLAATRG